MGILQTKEKIEKAIELAKKQNRNEWGSKDYKKARYSPTLDEQKTLIDVIKDFGDGYMNQQKPRLEFNDLSLIDRMGVDQLMWNTYQPNDGDAPDDDPVNSWRSRAIRPITRNKVISIAAHASSRLIFPKIFAYSWTDEEQQDAAQVMSDIMEWVGDQIDYPRLALDAIISALVNPISIIYTGFEEAYRTVKRPKKNEDGEILLDENDDILYEEKLEPDEELSGFQATVVPDDEFFFSDFYTRDVQKQDWVIWRRVNSYNLSKAKYGSKYENFKYVVPGVQTIYVDANQSYYEVYDANMSQNDVEEVLYWNRNKDLFLIVVNGVLLTKCDNPNPRNDKLFPFVTFFYEPIDEGRAIAGKSLVFKLAPDYRVINTLYPMVIDGTYLDIFPPSVATGSEIIGADVIVPGAVTTLSDPNARLVPLSVAQNTQVGMNTMFKIEQSINESSQEPISSAQRSLGGQMTAYEISRLEQNNNIILGLFMTMIKTFVMKFGRLVVGDILQYMTIGEVKDIEGEDSMIYKSFILPEKLSDNETKTRKISFDSTIQDEPMTEDEFENESFKILEEEGGEESDLELYKVNPSLFRKLKYELKVSPDTLNPLSEEAERAFMLEEYDRAIQNPLLDQNAVTKDFLLSAYPKSKRNTSKYFRKAETGGLLTPGSSLQTDRISSIMGNSSPEAPVADMAE